jgi:PKD repeat protein
LLTIENSNGCKSTISKESPFFYQTKFEVQNGSGCIPFSASFTDKTIDAQSWYWNFGDGNYSSASHPQHVYEKDGIYTVSLVTISSTGCADTLTLKDFIKVGVLDADFTMDVPQSLCTPLFAQFHNQSIGADSYLWNFGDGSSSTMRDPIHIYTKVGEFDVTLITQNEYGCEDTILHRNLARILGPEANFSISDSVLCHPQEFSIADKSVSAIRWEWFFGDGAVSNKQHPTYEYEEIGTYSISLIATDKFGCREFIKKDSLRVIKTPKAKFTVNAFEYCNPGRVEVVNETENIQNATYKWDFGDGRFSDALSPEIVYESPWILQNIPNLNQ